MVKPSVIPLKKILVLVNHFRPFPFCTGFEKVPKSVIYAIFDRNVKTRFMRPSIDHVILC